MQQVAHFIHTRHIDSFQKLLVLVFFYRRADASWTISEVSDWLYLGSGPLLESVIADLQWAGLIDRFANRYKLRDGVKLELDIQHLINLYENPMTRQEILKQLGHQPSSAFLGR